MKERPIIRSPYAYDIDNIIFMSEAERKRLYERKEYIEKEPYTVIDVLKKVNCIKSHLIVGKSVSSG